MCLMWSIFDSAELHSTHWSQMRVEVGTGLTVRCSCSSEASSILFRIFYPYLAQKARPASWHRKLSPHRKPHRPTWHRKLGRTWHRQQYLLDRSSSCFSKETGLLVINSQAYWAHAVRPIGYWNLGLLGTGSQAQEPVATLHLSFLTPAARSTLHRHAARLH